MHMARSVQTGWCPATVRCVAQVLQLMHLPPPSTRVTRVQQLLTPQPAQLHLVAVVLHLLMPQPRPAQKEALQVSR
jgi:hypothetical protein